MTDEVRLRRSRAAVGFGCGRVLADKAHSSRVNREYLRRRQIPTTIPIKADQAANRRNKGPCGGRPQRSTRPATAVECAVNLLKHHRAIATPLRQTLRPPRSQPPRRRYRHLATPTGPHPFLQLLARFLLFCSDRGSSHCNVHHSRADPIYDSMRRFVRPPRRCDMSVDVGRTPRSEWTLYWLRKNELRRHVADLLVAALSDQEGDEHRHVIQRVALASGVDAGYVQNTLWQLEATGVVTWTSRGFTPVRR